MSLEYRGIVCGSVKTVHTYYRAKLKAISIKTKTYLQEVYYIFLVSSHFQFQGAWLNSGWRQRHQLKGGQRYLVVSQEREVHFMPCFACKCFPAQPFLMQMVRGAVLLFAVLVFVINGEYSEANIISQVFCAKGTKKVVPSIWNLSKYILAQ